jgi:hypothetical protein
LRQARNPKFDWVPRKRHVLPERSIDAFHAWSMNTSEVNVNSTTQPDVTPRISTLATHPFCHWLVTAYRALIAGRSDGLGDGDGDRGGDTTVRTGRGDLVRVGVGAGVGLASAVGDAGADSDGGAADEATTAGISMTL